MRCWESEFLVLRRCDPHTIYKELWKGFDRQPGRPAPFLWVLTETGTVVIRSLEFPRVTEIAGALLRQISITNKETNITEKDLWRYVLVCSPTKRENASGKRKAIFDRNQVIEWLCRKGKQHGFCPVRTSIRNLGPVRWVSSSGHHVVHGHVEVSGVLTIIDADAFSLAMFDGIGSSKSSGMGMIILKEPDYGHATISNNGQTDKRSGNADRSNRPRRIVSLGSSSS